MKFLFRKIKRTRVSLISQVRVMELYIYDIIIFVNIYAHFHRSGEERKTRRVDMDFTFRRVWNVFGETKRKYSFCVTWHALCRETRYKYFLAAAS